MRTDKEIIADLLNKLRYADEKNSELTTQILFLNRQLREYERMTLVKRV